MKHSDLGQGSPGKQEHSRGAASGTEQRSLATRIWSIQWDQFFPYQIEDSDVRIERSTFDAFNQFATAHFKEIYSSPEPGPVAFVIESHVLKREFYESNGDFFAFIQGERIVGFFIGNALDWGTYYLRSVSLLPEFQGQKLFQSFLKRFLECMEASQVARIEAQVAPSNLPNVHLLTKLGFNITGFNISERWGALVHFTKFLDDKHAYSFQGRFCYSPSKKDSSPGMKLPRR